MPGAASMRGREKGDDVALRYERELGSVPSTLAPAGEKDAAAFSGVAQMQGGWQHLPDQDKTEWRWPA
eukprot:361851-Chlamydomonas_euryale.AAC.4